LPITALDFTAPSVERRFGQALLPAELSDLQLADLLLPHGGPPESFLGRVTTRILSAHEDVPEAEGFNPLQVTPPVKMPLVKRLQ